MSTANNVMLITGGSRGIGAATALLAAQNSWDVAISYHSKQDAAQAVAAQCREFGVNAFSQQCEVADESSVLELFTRCERELGTLSCLVNNAGIGGAFGPITEIKAEDWDETFAILTKGVFLGIKHGARVMIDQGQGGSIINTASIAGIGGGAGPQPYSAAKAAVINLGKNTATELAPHNIRVNSICPGLIFTPLMHSGEEEDAERVMNEFQPLKRRGEGSDIAGAALFLAGDDSSFITGQSITVDGGLLAVGPGIHGQAKNTRNLHRNVGMAHGTTGRPSTVKRLDE